MRDVRRYPLFVYGTLRQSRRASHFLAGYQLLDLGPFPGVVPKRGSTVMGNVVHVSEAELAACDRVEGVRRGFFNRVTVSVRNLPGFKGKDYESCFVYVAGNVLDHGRGVPVPSGDWHNHPTKQSDIFSPFA
jgi:gamma-glutamylcyclotransferase (GGCT)/AIG2-like uncharacterized protein YtfP